MGSPFAPRPPSSGFGIHRNPTAPVPLPLHLEPTSPGTPSGIVSVLDDMTSRSVDTRTYGPGEILITDDNGHLTALPAAPIKDSPLLKFIDGHPHWSKTFDGDYVFGKITATTLISSTLALDDLTLNAGGSFTLTGWAAGSIGYINGSAAFTQLAAGVGAANKLLQHGPAGAMPQWTDLNLLVAGTTNQVTVGDNGDGSLTLSLPQDLDTGADLRIGSLGVGVAATGAAGDAKFGDSSTYMFWDKSTSIFKITGESAGASDGPDLLIKNNSASQQDSDRAGSISFYGSDSGGAEQLYGRMRVNILDVTAATEDSNIEFQVAQAGSLIVASLSNAGVWTDASSASLKTYEGSLRFGALETVAMLDTGVYRGHKRGSEQHISPTAEQWRSVTGLRGTPAGIAPKDLAGLALLAIVELQDEVRALRAQIRST